MIEYIKGHERYVMHGNIDQTPVNSLYGLLSFEIGGLACLVLTTEYIVCVHCKHVSPICNALVHVIYIVVSGKYS
mgnify:FL=1